MSNQNFSVTLIVDQTPEEVFNAVSNVRKWWSGYYAEEIVGSTEKLNDEFSFRAGGGAHYSKQKLVELVPNEKMVWLVTDSKLNSFKDKNEWTDTKIVFEVGEINNKTQVRFTHVGLTPRIECYSNCSTAWEQLIQKSLVSLITTGKGTNVFG